MKILLMLLAFTASCACWKPESPDYNAPKCVIARQVIDCSVSSVRGMLPAVIGILGPLLVGGVADWSVVLDRLIGQGIENGMCIIAALQADFMMKPKSLADDTNIKILARALDEARKRNGVAGVKVKLLYGGKTFYL